MSGDFDIVSKKRAMREAIKKDVINSLGHERYNVCKRHGKDFSF